MFTHFFFTLYYCPIRRRVILKLNTFRKDKTRLNFEEITLLDTASGRFLTLGNKLHETNI